MFVVISDSKCQYDFICFWLYLTANISILSYNLVIFDCKCQYEFICFQLYMCATICLYNSLSQVLKKYKYGNYGYWSSVLNKAAYAMTYNEFDRHMNEMMNELPQSKEYLEKSNPKLWANALFEGNRWGVINNNLVESWNAWIVEARSMAPVAMVEKIRTQVMTMMNEKRESSMYMNGELCPQPEKILHLNYMDARGVCVIVSSGEVFQLQDLEKTMVVNVKKMTCTYG